MLGVARVLVLVLVLGLERERERGRMERVDTWWGASRDTGELEAPVRSDANEPGSDLVCKLGMKSAQRTGFPPRCSPSASRTRRILPTTVRVLPRPIHSSLEELEEMQEVRSSAPYGANGVRPFSWRQSSRVLSRDELLRSWQWKRAWEREWTWR